VQWHWLNPADWRSSTGVHAGQCSGTGSVLLIGEAAQVFALVSAVALVQFC